MGDDLGKHACKQHCIDSVSYKSRIVDTKSESVILFIVTLPLMSNSHLFISFISCALSTTPPVALET